MILELLSDVRVIDVQKLDDGSGYLLILDVDGEEEAMTSDEPIALAFAKLLGLSEISVCP